MAALSKRARPWADEIKVSIKARTIPGEGRRGLHIGSSSAEVSAKVRTPKGRLRVSAPSEIGRRRIAPLVSEFTELRPATSIELILTDAKPDVLRGELDLGLQTVFPRMVTSSSESFLEVAASYAPRRGIFQSTPHRKFPRIELLPVWWTRS
jgi:DNA-binding transcriptional LysR family regulator